LTNINADFVGKVLLTFTELESTQNYAQELLLRSEPEEGTLVRAAYQTEGKGLLRNRWESERGKNLLLSVIFYPSFLPVQRTFLLSQAMALGVQNWMERYAAPAKVKWPNDIYIGKKKIAGMLIQNALSGAKLVHSIVGLGVNMNQTEFSPELPNPGSLALETGQTFDLDETLSSLCQHLEYWYLRLKKGQWEEIHAEYVMRLYGFGEIRTFARKNGTRFQGRIVGVAQNGYLQVETENGLQEFEMKEIRFS